MRTEHSRDDDLRLAADRALAEVKRVGRVEGRRGVYDPALNAALQPLRRLTLGSACRVCSRNSAWWAVDTAGCFVAPFQRRCPPRQRLGGVADCHDPDPSPIGHAKAPWILLAESGTTTVTIVDWMNDAGYPLRLQIRCPKCDARHVARNTTRLTQFLHAVSRGESKIWITD